MKEWNVGTRGSALALAQTEEALAALQQACPNETFIRHILKTQGDSKQGTARAGNGDKRDWMHELEVALLGGEIDLAVHSAKDVPVDIDEQTVVYPVLERTFPADVFVGRMLDSGQRLAFSDLQEGALVGTASKRRQAQLQSHAKKFLVQDHRGNVPTRIQNLQNNPAMSGIVLAHAGLERLNLFSNEMEVLPCAEFLPAVNQGIIAIQCRKSDTALCDALSSLASVEVLACFTVERRVIAELGADCHSAVAVYATVKSESIQTTAAVYSLDGQETIKATEESNLENAEALGISISTTLKHAGAMELLAQSRECYAK